MMKDSVLSSGRVGRGFRSAVLATSILSGLASAAQATAILPTGGNVVSGSAVIASSGSTLTVDQSTSKAIINWSSFSIGKGDSVQIDNGSGATLNRVTGLTPTQINGLLSSTGAVYILNANGVIIGKTGVVNTGGTFVASTLDTDNNGFLSGGPLSFAGPSTASVVNLGKIGSLGGNVALIAQSVTNAGTITAANGTIGLAAGSLITLTDDTADDGGLIKVQIGEAGDSLTNEGALAAAAIALRAQQGNIYALAGNTGGAIEATGVGDKGGKIFLVSQDGETTVSGTLDAEGEGGTPGSIETSGESLEIGSAKVNAHGGTWLLDPGSLTIDATAAATINAALGNDTSVVESTNPGNPSSGAGNVGTDNSGDIIIAAALSWSTAATLTLDSYHSIFINAPITITGPGGLVLNTNDGGGVGGDLYFAQGASVDYGAVNNGGTLAINGQPYTLLYALADGASTGPDSGTDDIAGIDNAGDGGYYALATNLTAPAGVTFASALAGAGANTFSGVFEGLGHTITGLVINDPTAFDNVGLFGQSSGVIRDINLAGGSVTGASDANVGGLLGANQGGTVQASSFSGAVTGGDYAFVGGLVGANYGGGTVTASNASGAVTGGAYATTGGLVGYTPSEIVGVGYPVGIIFPVYVTAAGVGAPSTGGLLGDNAGPVQLNPPLLGTSTGLSLAFQALAGAQGAGAAQSPDGAAGALGNVYPQTLDLGPNIRFIGAGGD